MKAKAFEAAIQVDQHDDILERLSEAAWGHASQGITIIDRENRNATNIEVTGTIVVDGREHWFHLRDGDMN